MSEFLESMMDLLKKGAEKDGSATAKANLQQTWDYPSLTAALPWRYYDDANDMFINAGSAGFIVEAAPLPGANEHTPRHAPFRKNVNQESTRERKKGNSIISYNNHIVCIYPTPCSTCTGIHARAGSPHRENSH